MLKLIAISLALSSCAFKSSEQDESQEKSNQIIGRTSSLDNLFEIKNINAKSSNFLIYGSKTDRLCQNFKFTNLAFLKLALNTYRKIKGIKELNLSLSDFYTEVQIPCSFYNYEIAKNKLNELYIEYGQINVSADKKTHKIIVLNQDYELIDIDNPLNVNHRVIKEAILNKSKIAISSKPNYKHAINNETKIIHFKNKSYLTNSDLEIASKNTLVINSKNQIISLFNIKSSFDFEGELNEASETELENGQWLETKTTEGIRVIYFLTLGDLVLFNKIKQNQKLTLNKKTNLNLKSLDEAEISISGTESYYVMGNNYRVDLRGSYLKRECTRPGDFKNEKYCKDIEVAGWCGANYKDARLISRNLSKEELKNIKIYLNDRSYKLSSLLKEDEEIFYKNNQVKLKIKIPKFIKKVAINLDNPKDQFKTIGLQNYLSCDIRHQRGFRFIDIPKNKQVNISKIKTIDLKLHTLKTILED